MEYHDCIKNLGGPLATKVNKYVYKNLGICKICQKKFIHLNDYGIWRHITDEEFKTITKNRRIKLNSFFHNNNNNEDVSISILFR